MSGPGSKTVSILTVAAVISAGMAAAVVYATTWGAANAADQDFVQKATLGGMAEVRFSEFAVTHARSDKTKELARMMVDDHGAANSQLQSITTKSGFDPPSEIDDNARTVLAKLSSNRNAAFDSAYVNQMVADHEKTVALFRKESTNGSSIELKSFAKNTLPTIEHHLQMAKDLKASLAPKK